MLILSNIGGQFDNGDAHEQASLFGAHMAGWPTRRIYPLDKYSTLAQDRGHKYGWNRIVKLRELQDETHGFVAFIPLAFHPDNTALSHIPKTSGYLDLRNIAVSRLMLDNFDHIKAYWIMLTPSIAQIAQRFGANDLDGTVVEEKIYHDAGAKTSEFTPRNELERLIRAAGRVPVERDTLYRPVDRSKMPAILPATPPGLVSLSLNV